MIRARHLIIIISIFICSCEPKIDEFSASAGDADFSVFTSLGCYLTSGFTNNELYATGQIVSFPNIISRQLLHVGGDVFKQPLMRDELGFGNKLILRWMPDCTGDSIATTTLAGGIPDDQNLLNIFSSEGPFHNLGVPGARIHHLLTPLNNTQNPFSGYFNRFSSSLSTTPLQDALALEPTFFSLWIGISDILAYAANGGTIHPIIEPRMFDQYLTNILSQLTATTPNGIIANLPDLLDFPFFSAVDATDLWVNDPQSPDGKRQLAKGEKVLLNTFDLIRCSDLGSINNPVPENGYLGSEQIHLINERIAEFNIIIQSKAREFNIALFYSDILFKSVSNGAVFDGLSFNGKYLTGNFFSLDGINLTRRGNAIIANGFIESINRKYNSTIPKVSVAQFQGIEFP